MLISLTRRLAGGLLLALCSVAATAAPAISLTVTAEKDVVVTDETGNQTTQRVEATDTAPGDVLFYTIHYHNNGDEPARSVRLDNPVPAGTAYIEGSAWGDGAEVLFSADDGENFAKADGSADGEDDDLVTRPYDAIRWVIAEIPQGAEGTAGFSVQVQ